MRPRLLTLALAASCATLAGAAACSGDSPAAPSEEIRESSAPKNGGSGGNGTGSDTTRPPTTPPTQPPPTSNGPVASVAIHPAHITVPTGAYIPLVATALDAQGRVVTGKRFDWRSADPSIVAVADTGILRAGKVGSTTVTASVDGHQAEARVTVVQGPPVVQPAPPVDKFTVRGTVYGFPANADTTTTPPARVSGATVTVYRVGSAAGDTLKPRQLHATTTTDAQGQFTLTDVPSAFYTVEVEPPAGSAWGKGTSGFGPQSQREIALPIALRAKP